MGTAIYDSLLNKLRTKDKLPGVFTIKGTKETTSELPSTGNENGDVWHINADGSEYVWIDSNRWEQLGGASYTVDAALSTTSTNPVQNKVIKAELDAHYSITAIPASTTVVSLAETTSTHTPASAVVYTLPAVTDTTVTHTLTVYVDCADTTSITFKDSAGNTITPRCDEELIPSTKERWRFTGMWEFGKWRVYGVRVAEAPQGTIVVTLSPDGVPGQWTISLDSEVTAWYNADDSVSREPGTYTLRYRDVDGYTTPASETVTLVEDTTITKSGTYIMLTGALTVNITNAPSGAAWKTTDESTWHNPGTSATYQVGSHTVEFKAVTGYSTPSSQAVSLTTAGTTVTAAYTELPGTLTVTISGCDSGQWSVDGGTTWYNSGSQSLAAGTYTITFKAVSGYTPPSAISGVTLTAGGTATRSAAYTALSGTLTVTITGCSSGQWSVDNGTTWNNSGVSATLSAGTYTVTFKPVSGYTTPASQTVTVSAGASATATGAYVEAETPPEYLYLSAFGEVFQMYYYEGGWYPSEGPNNMVVTGPNEGGTVPAGTENYWRLYYAGDYITHSDELASAHANPTKDAWSTLSGDYHLYDHDPS